MNFTNAGRIEGKGDFGVYNFDGDLPTDNFILTIITPEYYAKYGNTYVSSALKTGERVHLHFINPYVGSALVYELPKFDTDLVTITTSTHPNMFKNLFCPYRFSIILEIMFRVDCGFWMFDIDGEFIKSGLDYSSEGIGLFVRNKEDFKNMGQRSWDRDWFGTYLAAFYIFPNEKNEKCMQVFIDNSSKLSLRWCSCQGVMYRLFQKHKNEFNFFQVQDEVINIWPENKNNYLFYHYGKGQKL